jgi:ribonuclease HI
MEWHIYIDGASSGNPGEAGAGIVVFDEKKNEILSESIYLGHMTNNMAEYSALIAALQRAEKACVQDLFIYTDSQLVAYQIQGKYKVKNHQLSNYVEKAKTIIKLFNNFDIQYIPRTKNKLADKLAKNGINKKG